MLRARWTYLWLFAWFALPGRFTSVFLLSLGISEADVGYMYALAIYSPPPLHFRAPCLPLLSVSLLSFIASMIVAPVHLYPPSIRVLPQSIIAPLYRYATSTLISLPSAAILANLADSLVYYKLPYGRQLIVSILIIISTTLFLMHGVPEYYNFNSSQTLRFIFYLRVVLGVFKSPIMSIIDGATLVQIKMHNLINQDSEQDRNDRSDRMDRIDRSDVRSDSDDRSDRSEEVSYGSERLYGAVSWAFTSVVYGLVLDSSLHVHGTYWLALITCVPILATQIHSGLALYHIAPNLPISLPNTPPISPKITPKIPISSSSSSPFQSIPQLLLNYFATLRSAIFLLSLIILSMGMSIVENLLFIFFTKTLLSSYTLCGISVIITVIFELPIFYYSIILQNNYSRDVLLAIAMFAYSIRVFGYTMSSNGYMVLLFEPLHGVTIGCSVLAAVDFASSVCPAGLESTSQTLLNALRTGVGAVVGTGLAGIVEQTYGSTVLYRSAGSAVLVMLIVHLLVMWKGDDKLTGVGVGGTEGYVRAPTEDEEEGGEKLTVEGGDKFTVEGGDKLTVEDGVV